MKLAILLMTLAAAGIANASEITTESVVATMNVHRIAAGLGPLRADARVVRAADDRMRDMEEQAYWAHVSPEGRAPFEWLRPRGYSYSYAGENLASGFETAEVLVESWMESKGHRDNILSPLFQDCGVSILEGSTLGRSTGKSIVVLFARPMVTPSPAP